MSDIFKSDLFAVDLSDSPVAKGHLTVQNSKVLSDCSDAEVSLFFAATSQCATALFELLGAHGTNIIVSDSKDSLSAHIISRMQNDGLNFLWEPTRGDPNALDGVAKSIKDEVDLIVWKRDNPDAGAPSSSSEPEVIKSESSSDDGKPKVNYLLKKLHRTP